MKKKYTSEYFIISVLLGFLLSSCLKIEPSLFDTSQNVLALAVEIAQNNGADTGTGSANNNQVATPTFSPSEGLYYTSQNITITTTTSGASIYYTTDGSTPTTSSTLYSSPWQINWKTAGTTVKAIAIKSGMTDSAVLSGVFSYSTLKTGQTQCFDNAGTVIGCAGTRQDGELQLGVARSFTGPSAHPTYTTDYTTTDNATGLVWKACTQGLSGAACATGTAQTLTWANASADATWGCSTLNSANSGNGYAGITTWRIPTRMELETLIDHNSTAAPRTFNTAFPATVTGNNYWTSTVYAPNSATRAWTVEFFNGWTLQYLKTDTNFVRCVSGTATNPAYSYTDYGDGTVKDNSTGLVWQRCSQGQNNDSTCSGTATRSILSVAMTNCNALGLAGRTWRLPNIHELKTLVDTTSTATAKINATAFPSTPIGAFDGTYHSTTTFDPDGGSTDFQIYFGDGSMTPSGKTNAYNVRCVSGP